MRLEAGTQAILFKMQESPIQKQTIADSSHLSNVTEYIHTLIHVH